ncbi:hypothetical protein Acidovoranil_39740 [Acidovorax sp. FG27]
MEPTEVVAMAAGLARLGAAIELKLADLNVALSLPPPQAVRNDTEALAPSGSMGMPARNWRALRRVGIGVLDIVISGG